MRRITGAKCPGLGLRPGLRSCTRLGLAAFSAAIAPSNAKMAPERPAAFFSYSSSASLRSAALLFSSASSAAISIRNDAILLLSFSRVAARSPSAASSPALPLDVKLQRLHGKLQLGVLPSLLELLESDEPALVRIGLDEEPPQEADHAILFSLAHLKPALLIHRGGIDGLLDEDASDDVQQSERGEAVK